MSKAIFTAAITGSIHTPTMSPTYPSLPTRLRTTRSRPTRPERRSATSTPATRRTACPPPTWRFSKRSSPRSRASVTWSSVPHRRRPGHDPEQRVAIVSTCKPELASCNMGSMNFALFPSWRR